MSVIDQVALMCGTTDRATVQGIDLDFWSGPDEEFPNAVKREIRFGIVDTGQAGGDKVFCELVALACINYLDVDEMVRRIEAAPWRSPESVVLLIQREQRLRPSVWGFEGATSFGSLTPPYRTEPLKLVQLAAEVPS